MIVLLSTRNDGMHKDSITVTKVKFFLHDKLAKQFQPLY